MTHLRKIMLEELERHNYSETTKECYIRAVEEFANYFDRPPDRLRPEHIQQFQAHLFTDRQMAPNTVNQRLAALRFFYVKTLHRPWNAATSLWPHCAKMAQSLNRF
jgi:integrase/recombinase XerD